MEQEVAGKCRYQAKVSKTVGDQCPRNLKVDNAPSKLIYTLNFIFPVNPECKWDEDVSKWDKPQR